MEVATTASGALSGSRGITGRSKGDVVTGASSDNATLDIVNADTAGSTGLDMKGGTTNFHNNTSAGTATLSFGDLTTLNFYDESSAGSSTPPLQASVFS